MARTRGTLKVVITDSRFPITIQENVSTGTFRRLFDFLFAKGVLTYANCAKSQLFARSEKGFTRRCDNLNHPHLIENSKSIYVSTHYDPHAMVKHITSVFSTLGVTGRATA